MKKFPYFVAATVLAVSAAGVVQAATKAEIEAEARAAAEASAKAKAATAKAKTHEAQAKIYDAAAEADTTVGGTISDKANSLKHKAGAAWENTKAGYNENRAQEHTENMLEGISPSIKLDTSATVKYR